MSLPAISRNHLDDLIYWPDGDWCYASELPEMGHKSDDYHRISVDHPEYHRYVANFESL